MSNQVAVMALVNIKPQAKYSGITRLMFNRFSSYRPSGLLLQKHMGSGKNAGFSVNPRLRAYSVKGKWSGHQLTESLSTPPSGPIASLTRASIKPLNAISFWSKAPPAEIDLQGTPGCLISAGVGEAPILRQATFTIWESQAAMDSYARSGAHLAAIKAAMQGNYFSESMFVRFQPFDAEGTWKGKQLD